MKINKKYNIIIISILILYVFYPKRIITVIQNESGQKVEVGVSVNNVEAYNEAHSSHITSKYNVMYQRSFFPVANYKLTVYNKNYEYKNYFFMYKKRVIKIFCSKSGKITLNIDKPLY